MVIFIFIFFLNLINLSYEQKELPLFDSISINVDAKTEVQIYLNTSIYQIGDLIKLSIEFESENDKNLFYTK